MMRRSRLHRLVRRSLPGSGDFSHNADYYVAGNRLTLLTEGQEAFRSMLEAIDAARETIHLETYIFAGDEVGAAFAERLAAKALRGVRVRLIIDGIGSLGLDPALLTRMRNAGVQVLEYRPASPWRTRWGLGRRDHRKILVVDGRMAFTGGMNIWKVHSPIEAGGFDWRDTHVRLEGPAAYELERLFRAVWFKETGRWYSSSGPHPEALGPSRVWVAANQEFLYRYRIRSAYLKALRAARRHVSIANAYFIPDRRIRNALALAARRGVQTRVLVPGGSDVPSVWHAGRSQYDYLLRHGVRLFEWLGPNLHAKTAVVDQLWCAVGTYNLDHRSLLLNLEVNLHVLDEEFAARLQASFEKDLERSREITLEIWRRRPFLDKVLERMFYLFRYFF